MGAPVGVRAEFRGEATLAGLSPEYKAYSKGFTAGHDDARDGEAQDVSLATEQSYYASGYRDGYASAVAWG
jgi:hypothetical protein